MVVRLSTVLRAKRLTDFVTIRSISPARAVAITDLAEAKKYLKDCCYVQFQIIDDLLERGQVEGLLSFLLNVRYLYEEH